MKKQSTMGGFAVLSAASLIVKALSILYIPILLGIIGEEGNGIYAAAYQVYVFVYVLTNSGIPVAISKLVSELTALNNYKDALRSFKIARFLLIIAGTITTILMMALALPVARLMHFEKSYLAILALSPTLLFTSIASAYRGYFQGKGNMIPTALSQVLEQVVNVIFTILFASLLIKYGVEAACAGGTVGTSFGALCAAILLIIYFLRNNDSEMQQYPKNMIVKRYRYKQLVRKLLNYSIPITLSTGFQYAGNLIDVWNTKSRLLAAGFTDEKASILYSHLYKYQQLMNVPISIVSALAATVLPAVAGASALKDRKLVQDRINYAFRICMLIVIPSAAGYSVLSRQIFEMLRFGEGSYIMMYGSFILVLQSIVQIQTIVLQASGKLYSATFHLVWGIIAKITVNYVLISIPSINIMGSILGSLAGYAIPLLLNNIKLKKAVKIRTNLVQHAFRPLISSVMMTSGILLVNTLLTKIMSLFLKGYINTVISTTVSIIFGICIYGYCIVITGGIRKEDIQSIPQKIQKYIPKRLIEKIK